MTLSTLPAHAQSVYPGGKTGVEVRMGLTRDGMVTDEWYSAITDRLPRVRALEIKRTPKPLSEGEKQWLELIQKTSADWSGRRSWLHVPFKRISLPAKIYILVGNQIGDDGFTHRNDTLCVDVGAMQQNYGDAGSDENRQRLIRLLDHEYTHLIHHEWIRRNPISMRTPLDRALRDLIVEGVGNYRSLSSKWVDRKRGLTDLANRTLNELQPIFVERLKKLSKADGSTEPELRQGLSRGPFNKKWGALTMALWLAKETQGDERILGEWIERGPRGVLELADRHLPKELKAKFVLTASK